MRDFQRARVYRAEDYIDSARFITFSTIDECRNYANLIWQNPKIRARFPTACERPLPNILKGKSKTVSYAYWPPYEKITLSRNGQKDYWIIHEIAHIITEREYGQSGDWIKHGPEWVATHLFLVKVMLGTELAQDLTEAFLVEGVKFTHP